MTVYSPKDPHPSQPGISSVPFTSTEGYKEDLFQVLITLVNGKKWIALATGLGILFGIVFIFLSPKIYVASAQVVIDTREQSPTDSGAVLSNMDVTAAVVAGEVVSLQSNVLLRRVVNRLGLASNDLYLPEDESVRSAMSEDDRIEYATAQLARNLDVRQVGISFAINIIVGSEDPNMAAAVANEIARQYIFDQIELKRDATLQASEILQDRVVILAQEVEQSEEAVVKFRRDLIARLGADQSANEQVLSELNTELNEVASALTDLTVRFETASRLFEEAGIDAVQDLLTSPLLSSLAAERATVEGQRARLATSLGERHPEIVRITAQLEDIERSMRDELSNQLEALRREVDVAEDARARLLARIEDAQSRQNEFQSASVRLGQLERAAEASRFVYENFLGRLTETTAQVDFQAPEARMVGTAIPPSQAASPRTASVLSLSALAGLAVGVAGVLLRAAIHRPVSSVSQLESLTRLPVLASLPFIEVYQKWMPNIARTRSGQTIGRYTERVRSLRSWLMQKNRGKKRIIMITSSLADEGKSMLALTLANTLHQINQSVVILDSDLRRSHSRGDLGLENEAACLVDYLERDGEPSAKLIQEEPEFQVSIVAPMRRVEESSDLLTAPAYGKLVRYLSKKYDFVIIDAPPVISLADTQIIAEHADWAIFVVKNQKTRDRLVSMAIRRLMETGVTVVGTVLCQVRASESRSDEIYGYYYG